jgi:putative DNA primase/helicase
MARRSGTDGKGASSGAPNPIPEELRTRRQWVVWRYEQRDGRRTKVPYQARPPRDRGAGGVQRAFRASATDPSTWRSFEEAVHVAADGFNGVGFVFTNDDPFTGIDLDGCFDDGDLHPAAASNIVDTLDSYTERSISKTGLHVIVRASMNGHGRNRTGNTPWGGDIEIYYSGRFFVMSGDRIEDTPDTIEERQAELDRLVIEWLPKPNGWPPSPCLTGRPRARTAKCSPARSPPRTATR